MHWPFARPADFPTAHLPNCVNEDKKWMWFSKALSSPSNAPIFQAPYEIRDDCMLWLYRVRVCDVHWTLWPQLCDQSDSPCNSTMASVRGRSACGRGLGRTGSSRNREGANCSGDHRLEPTGSLLHALHPQPRSCGPVGGGSNRPLQISAWRTNVVSRSLDRTRCALALGARLAGAQARPPALRRYDEGRSGYVELSGDRSLARSAPAIWRNGHVLETDEGSQCHRPLRAAHLRDPDARDSVLRLLRPATNLPWCCRDNCACLLRRLCRGCSVARAAAR